MRCFVGLPLPGAVRANLESLQAACRGAGMRADWVRGENLHLTLRFLGEVEPGTLAAFASALAPLCAEYPAVALEAAGLGLFPAPPHARRPGILWVGIRPAKGALLDLQHAIETAAAAAGFLPETRPFHPHVTLARFQFGPAQADVPRLVAAHETYSAGAFTANHVTLWESTLERGGARYAVMREFPLA